MKIVIDQINPVVGKIPYNIELLKQAYLNAAQFQPDLLVTGECGITGYPLEDLVLKPTFIETSENAVGGFISWLMTQNLQHSMIFGAPVRDKDGNLRNRAFLIDPVAQTVQFVDKMDLPNSGVFDEKRVFVPATKTQCLEWRDQKLGLMICEDMWHPNAMSQLLDSDLVVVINGSPFEPNKTYTRLNLARERLQQINTDLLNLPVPIVYANLVGGQDELVFDGGSFFFRSEHIQFCPLFEEGQWCFDTTINDPLQGYDPQELKTVFIPLEEQIYKACVLGLRDYFKKQGFKTAILGLSGGIDSALVAVMAVDALGAENVYAVRMPSKYSSDHSLKDALDLATNLGIHLTTINIQNTVDALLLTEDDFGLAALPNELSEENAQARVRGMILMRLSNKYGHIVLSTGNKSEVSVGYATLYGDMCGGFNPLKDVYKVGHTFPGVFPLCRWRNTTRSWCENLSWLNIHGSDWNPLIPENIITKPPSAELKPDQKDVDSLPEYPILDDILEALIEKANVVGSYNEVVTKYGVELVNKIQRMLDTSEYKRRQGCPGVKVTKQIHGRDRRFPIVNGFRL